MDKHQKAVNTVLDALTSLEKECSNMQFDNKENFESDVAKIRTQVRDCKDALIQCEFITFI